jgi:hypothetical protein
MSLPAALEEASALVGQTMRLLETARRLREALGVGVEPTGVSASEDAERLIYLGITEALEGGLVRALEDVVNALRAMRGMAAVEAEGWLRRQLEGLTGPEAGERRE